MLCMCDQGDVDGFNFVFYYKYVDFLLLLLMEFVCLDVVFISFDWLDDESLKFIIEWQVNIGMYLRRCFFGILDILQILRFFFFLVLKLGLYILQYFNQLQEIIFREFFKKSLRDMLMEVFWDF